MNTYDLIVVGAGSSGAGAAVTAGRLGLRTLWIEKEAAPGGTGVHALVNVWQPDYSASALARDLAGRLLDRGRMVFSVPTFDTPAGRPLYRIAAGLRYDDTLRRWEDFPNRRLAPALVYDPEAMAETLVEMARETGRIDLQTDTTFLDCRTEDTEDGQRLLWIETDGPAGRVRHSARWFIDATADIALAVRAGCRWAIGQEPQAAYGEPSAPPEPVFRLNGWTLCFLVRKGADLPIAAEPWGHDGDWAHIGQMPDGRTFYVNMVFQLPGEVAWRIGEEQARERLLGNIVRRWERVRRAYGLDGYGIARIAPRVGRREGPRIVARSVFTENTFRQGGFGRDTAEPAAFGDHAMDTHAPGKGCTEAVSGVWAVPFGCLRPAGFDNLLVVSRGAGFSSLGASAARLQRTLMTLGESAARFAATGRPPRIERPPYRAWQPGASD